MKKGINFWKRIFIEWIAMLWCDPKQFVRYWAPRCFFNRIPSFLYIKMNPDHPWLTQQANQILSTLLMPTDVGLEFGSGKSTLWLAQRIKHLTTVVHDESWYKAVTGKIKAANISNVNYLLCKVTEGQEKAEESSYVQVVNTFSKDSLDFFLIDGCVSRCMCEYCA